MLRRSIAAAAVVLGALMGVGPAAAVAHPLLTTAAPGDGLITPKSPDAIRIALSEPVVARGSFLKVTGPHGAPVATSSLTASGDGRSLSVVPRSPLRSAVYTVRWAVLGDDGHRVGGTFHFGVAGAAGAPPPGAERLGGASAGARGGEDVEAASIVDVVAGWLGILAASALLGGAALLATLRRRDRAAAARAAGSLRPLAPLAWLLVALAALEGLLAGATAGTDGSLDLGLLTDAATGRVELARAGVVLAVSVLLVVRARGWAFALGGALVLLTYALSGHALVEVSVLGRVAQVAHVLTAGLWLGGLIALVLLARERAGDLLGAAARAFAPVAAGALGVAVVTGVLAALREVDRWYFLRWSDYGRVVLVKGALVAVVAVLGAIAWRRGARPRLLRLEAAGVLAVVALATVLGGLSQGRGRPMPAQEGTLVPGAAYATALLPDGARSVALSPARKGANVLTLLGTSTTTSARVKLQCACATAPVSAELRPGAGAWSARVDLPADGRWYGYVTVDDRAAGAPVALSVGVPKAPGMDPATVLVATDLTGPGAARCRDHALGVQLATGRVNAEGGVDGGRKLVPLVVGLGDAVRTAATLHRAPVAAAVCGDDGAPVARALAHDGIPVVVGDPGVAPVREAGIYRSAADPYAQGVGLAQYAVRRVLPGSAPGVRTVLAAVTPDAIGTRLLAGLREGLAGTGLTLKTQAPGTLGAARPSQVKRAIDRERILALVLDQPSGTGKDLDALAALGKDGRDFPPAPVLASSRVLSERLILRLGNLGRIGVLQGTSEVATQTADALAYARTLPGLWPGELPSLDGLRGYVAGLAIRSALRGDTKASAVRDRLRTPKVFSDALLAPWDPRHAGTGSPAVVALAPQFLATTITPPSAGGMSYTGTWFPDGAWINASVRPLGPAGGTPPLT